MERDRLFKAIQMYDFALDELNLYLDTHPGCTEAVKYFRQYQMMADKCREEYEGKYGSLTAYSTNIDKGWDWVNAPWPWEKGGN